MKPLIFLLLLCTTVVEARQIQLPALPQVIVQADQGYMLFGTETGVMQWNGNQLINFSTRFNLPTQSIHSIRNIGNNELLIAGEMGVYRFDGENITELTHGQPFVDAIYHLGRVHMLGYDGYFDGTATTNEFEGRPKKLILWHDEIYILTTKSLCNTNTKKCELGDFYDATIVGDLLVTTGVSGIKLITTSGTSTKIELDSATYLHTINDHQVAVVVNNKVSIYDTSTHRLEHNIYNRSGNNHIFDIYQSRDGTTWVAANEIELLTRRQYKTTYTDVPSISGGRGGVFSHDGQLFIGDTWGVAKINADTGETIAVANAPTHVYTMKSTNHGLLIGGYYGLSIFDNQTITPVAAIDGVVLCINQLSFDVVAICHGKKLSHLKLSDFTKKQVDSYPFEVTDLAGDYVSTGGALYENNNRIDTGGFIALLQPMVAPRLLLATTIDSGVKVYRDGKAHRQFGFLGIGSKCTNIVDAGEFAFVGCSAGFARIKLSDLSYNLYPTAAIPNITLLDNRFFAITGNIELLSWGKSLPTRKYTPQLMIDTTVHGNHVVVNAGLTDYRLGNEYSYLVNGQLHRSNIGQFGFNTHWGQNDIVVNGYNSDGVAVTSHIAIYTKYPFLLRWYVMLIAAIFVLIYIYLAYYRRESDKILRRNRLLAFMTQFVNTKHEVSADLQKSLNTVAIHAQIQPEVFTAGVVAGLNEIVDYVNRSISIYQHDPLCSFDDNVNALVTAKKAAITEQQQKIFNRKIERRNGQLNQYINDKLNQAHQAMPDITGNQLAELTAKAEREFERNTPLPSKSECKCICESSVTSELPIVAQVLLLELIEQILYLTIDLNTNDDIVTVINVTEQSSSLRIDLRTSEDNIVASEFQTHAHDILIRIIELLNGQVKSETGRIQIILERSELLELTSNEFEHKLHICTVIRNTIGGNRIYKWLTRLTLVAAPFAVVGFIYINLPADEVAVIHGWLAMVQSVFSDVKNFIGL